MIYFRLESVKFGKFEISFIRKDILLTYNNALDIGLDYGCVEESVILPGQKEVLLDLVCNDDGYVNVFYL